MDGNEAMAFEQIDAGEHDGEPEGLMGEGRRFDLFFEKHIGIGSHWRYGDDANYWFDISFSIPFVTLSIGIGKKKSSDYPF